MNKDIYKSLSQLEKELRKVGRKVPVCFMERTYESTELLIKWKEEASVPADNPYLFARPGVMTSIHGRDCLEICRGKQSRNP